MDEHLQVLILPHIVSGVLVHSARVSWTEVTHPQNHRLFVLGDELGLSRICLSADSWRQNVVNRRTGTVLFYIDGLHVDRRTGVDRYTDRCQIPCVLSPVATHKVQGGKTKMGLFGTAGEVHTHETDGLPVADRTDLLHGCTIPFERYLELIPSHIDRLTVTQRDPFDLLLGDMLAAYLHHVRTKDDFVLVIFLVLVEGVILVDIFYIGVEGGRRTVTLRLLFGSRGVAFGTVEVFVTLQDWHLCLIEVGTAVIMVIIAGRVITG